MPKPKGISKCRLSRLRASQHVSSQDIYDWTACRPRKQRHPIKPNRVKGGEIEETSESHISYETSVPEENVNYSKDNKVYSQLETYIHELKMRCALQTTGSDCCCFVLQDCTEEGYLKNENFETVRRRAVMFEDKTAWVYWCTCSPYDTEKAMAAKVNMEYLAYTAEFPKCRHVNACQIIMEEYDCLHNLSSEHFFFDHNYDRPSTVPEDNRYYELMPKGIFPVADGICVMGENNNIAVVILKGTYLKCTKSKVPQNCIHVQKINSCLEDGDEFLASFMEKHSVAIKKYQRYRCYSQHIIKNDDLDYLKQPENIRFAMENEIFIFNAPPTGCHCHEQKVTLKNNVPLLLGNKILYGQVTEVYCPSCQQTSYFDGAKCGVLNMGTYMVSHEVLRHFMHNFVVGGHTIYGEYSTLMKMHKDSGHLEELEKIMDHQKFRHSWYGYLNLLEKNYADSFSCPVCLSKPQVLIMDATHISVRKQLIPWTQQHSSGAKIPGSIYKQRVAVENKEGRKLLRKLGNDTLNDDEFIKLQEILLSEYPAIKSLLDDIVEIETSKKSVSPKWQDFVSFLGAESSVCATLPPDDEFWDILNDFSELNSNPLKLRKLQEMCPVLFKVTESSHIPSSLACILEMLKQKSISPYKTKYNNTSSYTNDDAVEKKSYFPQLPILRYRGSYVADAGTLASQECKKKMGKGHPVLGPGTFTIFCQHGVCYGFELMHHMESPNVPFTIMRTRLQEGPDMVIYDNACHLQEYCLNREPIFFKQTHFRVDSLHWPNHTGCSPAFQLKSYPQHQEINSQVVEQSNSKLKKIAPMLSYMSLENFNEHMKFYLSYQNLTVKKRF